MKIHILLLFVLLLFAKLPSQAADPWLTIEGMEGIGKAQHIVFVTGEEYYRSEEGMSMFGPRSQLGQRRDCQLNFLSSSFEFCNS